jgi:coproporphyrinogen III oxidase
MTQKTSEQHLEQRELSSKWFKQLRGDICTEFEKIESDYAKEKNLKPGKFKRTSWDRDGGGVGVMSSMHGNVFEKVGVNISQVYGEFTEAFSKKIPGAKANKKFFATGVSLVAHMCSPLVPAMHFNTRYIETTKHWFGGGGDLTPMYPDDQETNKFHEAYKLACDKHNPDYYHEFKKNCDEYFYLKHRNEQRGVGGIFYDNLNSGNFENDFNFTKDVGITIKDVYPEMVRDKMDLKWTDEQREHQLKKRGRYVEFNLLYDRGTTFGLSTGGNVEAILMSMPPVVKWP